jgi:hypothetical protein
VTERNGWFPCPVGLRFWKGTGNNIVQRTLSWSRAIPARIEETDFVLEEMMGECSDPSPKDIAQNNLVAFENYDTLKANLRVRFR